MKRRKPETILQIAQDEPKMLPCGSTVPDLMPGWDLEAWADHILGLDRPGRRTDRRCRSYYSERELRRNADPGKRGRQIPCGQKALELCGYGPDGTLLVGSSDFRDPGAL